VGTDNNEAIGEVVKWLYDLGHREIAFLNGSKNSMVSNERHEAFVQTMLDLGLPVLDGMVEFGYYVPDCAKYHVPSFLSKGATAIICASDLIASGVMKEVSKAGLSIPEDVSIVGFDDLPICTMLSPKLSTIRQDRLHLGRSAYLLLDGLINGLPISKLNLRAKFIDRETIAPVRKYIESAG
jgi:LacI family transcriptional regulator